MSPGRITAVASAADARNPADGETVVVLDPAWTPDQNGPTSVVSMRPAARRALLAHDPYREALTAVDAFGEAAGLEAALTVGGVSLWYRRRLVAWRHLHDLITWRAMLHELGADPPALVDAPLEPAALREIAAGLVGGTAGAIASVAPTGREAATGSAAPAGSESGPESDTQPSWVSRLLRRARRAGGLGSARTLDPALHRRAGLRARVAALSGGEVGPRPLLVLTDRTTHQVVMDGGRPAMTDPFLGPIVDQLAGSGLRPVTMVLDARRGGLPLEAELASFVEAGSLPGWIIGGAFADATDDERARLAGEAVGASLAGARASLLLDGVDVGPLLLEAERQYAAAGLPAWVRARGRIGRLLGALQPAGILMVNEYSRPDWLAAARAAGVPVAAVQHGIIHDRHAGYVIPHPGPGLLLADRTYLFGDYEARLLTGASAYRPDQVRVVGSPRRDLLVTSAAAAASDGRSVIRARLGVDHADRMLVFSSTNNVEVRRLVVAPAIEALFDRPLPGVHLVVKLHPAEDDDGMYPRLMDGLARASGARPVRLSVVKDVDLFALLAAADAHLGIHSTVLTDAVVAGTPNVIYSGLAGSDLLDYVAAGVAVPARSGAELLAALTLHVDRERAAGDRAAFLADHFAPGPASRVIADDLRAWLGR